MYSLVARRFITRPITQVPANALTRIFQLPTPVRINIAAPINTINVEVSPIEPGIKPKNILAKLYRLSASEALWEAKAVVTTSPSMLDWYATPTAVAPE